VFLADIIPPLGASDHIHSRVALDWSNYEQAAEGWVSCSAEGMSLYEEPMYCVLEKLWNKLRDAKTLDEKLSLESVRGHVLDLGVPHQIAIDAFQGLPSNSNASHYLITVYKCMKLLMATLPSTEMHVTQFAAKFSEF
jgi:hypothetical protein